MNISELKYERLSEPERFLLDIIDGLVEYESVDYPDMIFYKKDDIAIFEYDSKNEILYYSYDDIRIGFRDKFDINYDVINDLVQSMVEIHLCLRVTLTWPSDMSLNYMVETHIK